jgi:hypothetical protein
VKPGVGSSFLADNTEPIHGLAKYIPMTTSLAFQGGLKISDTDIRGVERDPLSGGYADLGAFSITYEDYQAILLAECGNNSSTGDCDNDGYTNLQEFYRGTDPNDYSGFAINLFANDTQGNNQYNGRYGVPYGGNNGPKKTIGTAFYAVGTAFDLVHIAAGEYQLSVDSYSNSGILKLHGGNYPAIVKLWSVPGGVVKIVD